MQTFNSFNELNAAQNASPLQSQMSIFNVHSREEHEKMIYEILRLANLGMSLVSADRKKTDADRASSPEGFPEFKDDDNNNQDVCGIYKHIFDFIVRHKYGF